MPLNRRDRFSLRSSRLRKRRRLSVQALEDRRLLAVYYVDDDSTGSGSGPLGSVGNPFGTIQAAANAASAGDIVEIREGTYRESVSVPRSGSSTNPITFRAYNNEQVVISGGDLVGNWTTVSGTTDLWVATVNWNANNDRRANTLFVNGELKFEARDQAETDPIRIEDWGQVSQNDLTTTSLRSADLAGRGDDYWNGAKITYHRNDFTIETSTIADYTSSTGTVTFTAPIGSVNQKQTTGYYIHDTLNALDKPGEWYKGKSSDGAVEANRLYYKAEPGQNPNVLDIEFKRRAFGFNVSSRDHIHIEGITFRGVSVLTNSSTDSNIYRENTFYAYDKANFGRFFITGNNNIFRDNSVRQLWGSMLTYGGTRNEFVNNLVEEVGYNGVSKVLVGVSAREMLISHNTVRTFSEAFMDGYPTRSEISHNVFEDGGTLTWDTGVFDADGQNGDSSYSIFHHNIFRNTSSRGIYEAFYGRNNNAVIHHNLFYDFSTQTVSRPIFRADGIEFRQVYHNTAISTLDSAPEGESDASSALVTRYNNNVQISVRDVAAIGVGIRGNYNYSPSDFSDFAGKDFRLAAGSGAIDSGVVIPGINDGVNGHLDGAPDAGAFEFGQPAWTAGHDFTNLPTPVYSWQSLPGTNRYSNGQFFQGTSDWTTVSGTPRSLNDNSWNLNQSGASLTGTFRTRSVELTPGESIERTFTGLSPNTTYTVGTGSRLVNRVTTAQQYTASSGTFATGIYRDEQYVSKLGAGEWVQYNGINFGQLGQYNQMDMLFIRDPSARPGGPFPEDLSGITVQVRRDSVSGPVIAEFSDLSYGQEQDRWYGFRTQLLENVSGIHNIYVSISGANADNLGLGSLFLLQDNLPSTDLLTIRTSTPGASTVSAQIGTEDWELGYEEVSFKTGPSATSATVQFVNNGRLNGYLDRFFLIEGHATRGGEPRDASTGFPAQRSLSATTTDTANQITDGNLATNASSGNHPGSWLQVDLERTTPLHSIQLIPATGQQDQLNNFRLSVWSSDPDNGGEELWGRNYLTEGQTLASGESLNVQGDAFADDGVSKLQSVSGRFVRIQSLGLNNQGNHRLSLAELQVLSFRNGDLARTDGIAEQSSTEMGLDAANANDGNPLTRSSTQISDNSSWWQVRLSQPSSVGRIVLTNQDADSYRELSNFIVSVWDERESDGGTKLWEKSYFETGSVARGGTFTIDGSEVGDLSTLRLSSLHTALVVRIQLNGQNNAGNGRLSLADVVVDSSAASPARDNLAQRGIASHSADFYANRRAPAAGYARDANDGVIIPQSNFSTTRNQSNAWWQVELDEVSRIGQIVVYNRTDAANRLSNFDVEVWDGDPSNGGNEIWSRGYNYSAGAGAYNFGTLIGPGGALVIDGADTAGGQRLDEVSGARFVRVRLNGTNFLSLAEVQVWKRYDTVDLDLLAYNYDPGVENAVFAGAQWLSPDVAGDLYWTGDVTAIDRGSSAGNAYHRDFIGGSTPAILHHRVANGRYQLTLNMNDASNTLDNMYVRGEGVTLLSDIDRPVGQTTTISLEVDVTDGELDLEFGDADTINPQWAVNRIVLTRIPSGPPDITPDGGIVASGTDAVLSKPDPVGTLYYTTDGTDPRLPNGTVNPNAVIAGGQTTTVSDLQDFEGVTVPQIPAQWTATTTNSSSNWTTGTTSGDLGTIGAFVNNINAISDARLTSDAFSVGAGSRRIHFRNSYDVESTYDGGVLELSIGSGAFQDILAAGGTFVQGGYNATLSTGFGNPLAGRSAWSGNSGGFVSTIVDLPFSAIGENVRLRWRFGSDSIAAGNQWAIDTLQQTFEVPNASSIPINQDMTVNARTLIGNTWSDPANATFVVGDITPALVSFARFAPSDPVTASDSLVFRATFDEPVLNVDPSDFVVTGTTASISSVVAVQGTGEAIFEITVSGGDLATYDGEVGIDLSPSQNITSTAGGQLPSGEPAIDERYTVDNIAPQVESIIVNDGLSASRSQITSLRVRFDREVEHTSLLSAFALTNIDTGIQVGTINVASSDSNGKTTAVLTFSGASTVDRLGTGTLGDSLDDGNYRLDIAAGGVRRSDTNTAMDADHVFGGQTSSDANNDAFYRLYGDANGDGRSNLDDFVNDFLPAFDKTVGVPEFNAGLDHDGNGRVNVDDFVSGILPNFGKVRL